MESSLNESAGDRVRGLAAVGVPTLVMFAALVSIATVPAEASCHGCYVS